MKNPEKFKEQVEKIYNLLISMSALLGIGITMCILLLINPKLFDFSKNETEYVTTSIDEDEDEDKIENGIHVRTGFVDDVGLMETVNNCTNCHSSKLVIQNRMSKEQWIATIRWMQKTQNLWDLGGNEAIIVSYLSKNYAPKKKGRRDNLANIEWYELKD